MKNDTPLETIAREKLKKALPKCTEQQQLMFKRMYSHKDLEKPILEVVDDMPAKKLNHAYTQVTRTLNDNEKETTSDKNS